VTGRLAVGIWTVAVLIAAVALAFVATTDHANELTARMVLQVAVGLTFIGAGLTTWLNRPENRTGAIMIATGFAWFPSALTQSNHPVLVGIGWCFLEVPWAFFGWLILSYPTGRLQGWASKAVVIGAAVLTFGLRPAWVLFADLPEIEPGSPENGLLVADRPGLADAILLTAQLSALVLIAAAITILVRRWNAASPPTRRALTPPYVSFAATVVILAVALALDASGAESGARFFTWGALFALLLVPISFAVGMLRTRLARAGVSRLLVELAEVRGADALQAALARALNDPSLEVAYWLPEQNAFVDSSGEQLPLPLAGGPDRAVTIVERGSRRVAALLHDASLLSDPDLLEGVSAAAGLSLESERRLAELARSEARLRGLVDALPDLMFRLDQNGTYLDVQAGDSTLLARPQAELLGRNVREIVSPDVADAIMAGVARVIAGGQVEELEYSLALDDDERHFEARIAPIGNDEVVLVVRDISQRKGHELELQEVHDELRARLDDLQRERELVRAVVESAPSYFCLVNTEGRIRRFNRALERASGCGDDEDTRDRFFWDVFIAPEQADRVKDVILTAARTDLPSGEQEDSWYSTAGDRLEVAWSITPLSEDGRNDELLISGMDVTERKRHEAELRRSRARLVEAGGIERRRLERNLHDGAQQRLVSLSLSLRLAQGKLRTAPEEAERLLASASDELVHALEELRELARGIHPAILTDRGLEPALQSLVLRAPMPVTLAEAPDERLPEGVEAAAYYVVAEALTNVAKYAQASAATVRVSRSNGRAVVEVADDGVGGADPALGSGLRGLADRVEALDGLLLVESIPGQGTTIRAEIPVGAS
jgi:PAS domain S-box-containing protein